MKFRVYPKKRVRNIFLILFFINLLIFSLILLEDIKMFFIFMSIGTCISILLSFINFLVHGIKVTDQEIVIKTNGEKRKYVIKMNDIYKLQYRSYEFLGKILNDFSIYYKNGTSDVVFSLTDGVYYLNDLKFLFKTIESVYKKPLVIPEVINLQRPM